jgi:Spy/CpxP family protein refolding chaperone
VTKIFFIFVMTAVSSVAFGQGHHPYAGLEQRTVKALSEQQIADLRAGRGMGLALPAELNGYPGPSHVLENADALGLSAEQREHTKGLFEAMKAEAVPVGERLIEQEAKLDRLFADREVTPANLNAATEEIGMTQVRLRQTHLKFHLAMMDVLSPAQVERYRELRGYGTKADQLHHPRSQH